jgi:hypothetical protein
MNNIYDVLEQCIGDLENGVELETVLVRHPDFAEELRPILKASVLARARSLSTPAPSPDVVRRSRAKFLQQAAQMREAKAGPRKRMIPFFQRLAISFSLTALLLTGGTGLVGASSSALPGEHLYPVKRTWEDLRLFLTFDHNRKAYLESEYDNERLTEVSHLLLEGRDETIQFAGVYMQINGVMYVSGVTVLFPANMQLPADGATVFVTGKTNAQGFVEISAFELAPAGTVVPVGNPVEMEFESNSGSTTMNFEMHGTVESITNNKLVINGQSVYLDDAKISGTLIPGANVELKGSYDENESFQVSEIKTEDSESELKEESDSDSEESHDDSGDAEDSGD